MAIHLLWHRHSTSFDQVISQSTGDLGRGIEGLSTGLLNLETWKARSHFHGETAPYLVCIESIEIETEIYYITPVFLFLRCSQAKVLSNLRMICLLLTCSHAHDLYTCFCFAYLCHFRCTFDFFPSTCAFCIMCFFPPKETALRQELQKVDQQLRTELEELQHAQHLVQEFDPPFISFGRRHQQVQSQKGSAQKLMTHNKASNYHYLVAMRWW